MYRSLWKLLPLAMTLPILSCVPTVAEPVTPDRAPQRGRLMPPAALHCDRNDLTSYTGTVSHYSRSDEFIRLTLATDADTTEKFALRYSDTAMLIDGVPFTQADWGRIEAATGELRAGVRLTVWVCRDGKTPAVLDWRPAQP